MESLYICSSENCNKLLEKEYFIATPIQIKTGIIVY